jgi:REP element-mobilizing transposase RayT
MYSQTQPSKWYHLVWTTYGRRPCLKIAAAAPLCERALRIAAVREGWTLDTVLVSERQLHVLLAVPPEVPWQEVPRVLLPAAEETLKEAGLAPPGSPVFAPRGWCVPLASAISVSAVRRHLRQRKQQSATPGYR